MEPNATISVFVDDVEMTLGEQLSYTEEIEFDAKETLSKTYSLTGAASLSYDVRGVDLSLLDKPSWPPMLNDKFIIGFDKPAMIQARWHKRPRIRKKWLKRFGMKPDVVRVQHNVTALEYHPGHVLDEYECYNGLCATFNSLGFMTDGHESVLLRPDQKRKDIKIEW